MAVDFQETPLGSIQGPFATPPLGAGLCGNKTECRHGLIKVSKVAILTPLSLKQNRDEMIFEGTCSESRQPAFLWTEPLE
jgi:hypothetical protein